MDNSQGKPDGYFLKSWILLLVIGDFSSEEPLTLVFNSLFSPSIPPTPTPGVHRLLEKAERGGESHSPGGQKGLLQRSGGPVDQHGGRGVAEGVRLGRGASREDGPPG